MTAMLSLTPGTPPPMPVGAQEEAWCPMPDGTRLATRLWRPTASGPHPVLLMRQCYGRAIASTVTLAHPAWYAGHGYLVAVQDVRGTGGSEGVFDPLAAEAADGAAAVAWARGLPGANGCVGLYGFSYQGMTQGLALAGGARPEAVAPVMAAWETWAHMASEGGALRLDFCVSWAMQLGALRARHAGDAAAFEAFRAAAALPPGAGPALPEAGLRHPGLTHLPDWLAAIGDGAYWRARSPAAAEGGALRVPALHVGGWHDLFLPGTVGAHAAFAAAGAPTRLVIGPWPHIGWAGLGALSVDRLQLAWFDRFLKGVPNGVDEAPPISLHDITRGEWRGLHGWPETRAVFHLAGDGLAAAASTGRLEPLPCAASTEHLVHDPWRPVPARGAHLGAPFGMADRADLDARADVAVFQTASLARPLRLCGPARLVIDVASDAPSLDLSAVLSVLRRDRVATLAAGHLRAAPGRLELAIRPIAATVEPGERLRLSLAGAAWPAFAVNPGTGAAPETAAAMDRRPVHLALATPATLELTVAP